MKINVNNHDDIIKYLTADELVELRRKCDERIRMIDTLVLNDDEKSSIDTGVHAIHVIKSVRSRTGVDLMTAKTAVDLYRNTLQS
jgi:ribosomal protein L7/L12